MLFDLRGRGRRRAVKVIYAGLALLIGGGLILFGVGAGTGGGGLLNGIGGSEGGGGPSFSDKVKTAQKRVKRHPNNPALWAALAEAQLLLSGTGSYYEETTEKFTGKGKELLLTVDHSWNTYIGLEPRHPSASLAQKMVGVLGEDGLNQPSGVVQALQIVIAAKPSNKTLYADLAQYSYKAGNTRQGDLASKKAISLASKQERAPLKARLEAIKKNPNGNSTGSYTVPTSTSTTASTPVKPKPKAKK